MPMRIHMHVHVHMQVYHMHVHTYMHIHAHAHAVRRLKHTAWYLAYYAGSQEATKSSSLAVVTAVPKERMKAQVLTPCGVSLYLSGATVPCNGNSSGCLLIDALLWTVCTVRIATQAVVPIGTQAAAGKIILRVAAVPSQAHARDLLHLKSAATGCLGVGSVGFLGMEGGCSAARN